MCSSAPAWVAKGGLSCAANLPVQTLGRPPSLKLLGFKPRKGYLRFQETVKHSYFIYPDEEVRFETTSRGSVHLPRFLLSQELTPFSEPFGLPQRYTGSTRTFAALLQSMLKKEVVGFASFLARSNSRPQVVLLLPQVCPTRQVRKDSRSR